jgi:hypothetical protein
MPSITNPAASSRVIGEQFSWFTIERVNERNRDFSTSTGVSTSEVPDDPRNFTIKCWKNGFHGSRARRPVANIPEREITSAR